MRLKIRHETLYRYSSPVVRSVQSLRLTPPSDKRQKILQWHLDLPAPAPVHLDAYGNLTQLLTIEGRHDEIRIKVEGLVEMSDDLTTAPQSEALSPLIFLRETPLTASDIRLSAFSEEQRGQMASDPVTGLYALMKRIRSAVQYVKGTTNVQTTAAEVLSQGSGVCQDHSHLFIACCRKLGIPARYVSGYLYSGPNADPEVATHAWAEAWIDPLGWIGFDVANEQPVGSSHLRLAIGRDYLEACPVRGVRFGGGIETLEIQLKLQIMGTQQQ
jgi:transglutaminase-like putative cysteine protease